MLGPQGSLHNYWAPRLDSQLRVRNPFTGAGGRAATARGFRRSNAGFFSGASGRAATARSFRRSTCGPFTGASGLAATARSLLRSTCGPFTGASGLAATALRSIIHRISRILRTAAAALQRDGRKSYSGAEDKRAAHLHREEKPERLQQIHAILKLCKRFT